MLLASSSRMDDAIQREIDAIEQRGREEEVHACEAHERVSHKQAVTHDRPNIHMEIQMHRSRISSLVVMGSGTPPFSEDGLARDEYVTGRRGQRDRLKCMIQRVE